MITESCGKKYEHLLKLHRFCAKRFKYIYEKNKDLGQALLSNSVKVITYYYFIAKSFFYQVGYYQHMDRYKTTRSSKGLVILQQGKTSELAGMIVGRFFSSGRFILEKEPTVRSPVNPGFTLP